MATEPRIAVANLEIIRFPHTCKKLRGGSIFNSVGICIINLLTIYLPFSYMFYSFCYSMYSVAVGVICCVHTLRAVRGVSEFWSLYFYV